MNNYIDFTPKQTKFLALLTLTALIMAGYLFVRSFTTPTMDSPNLQVFIGESEPVFTGVFIVDLNTSPADSLELLPGIGKVLADRIVAYREHHRFEREVDITEVEGIGPKTFEKLKPYLRIQKWSTTPTIKPE
jgi:competence ComEA-like helix-hairpin-helix protein